MQHPVNIPGHSEFMIAGVQDFVIDMICALKKTYLNKVETGNGIFSWSYIYPRNNILADFSHDR